MTDDNTHEPRPGAAPLPNKAGPVPKAPQGAAETVVVACKLPNGLILHLDDWEDTYEPLVGGGTRIVKKARPRPQTYTVYGGTMDPERLFRGDSTHLVVGGFGVTPGIPRDFWEEWEKQNAQFDPFRNGFIFALPTEHDVRSEAKSRASLRSGFEPMDPNAIMQTSRSNISGVSTNDEQAA